MVLGVAPYLRCGSDGVMCYVWITRRYICFIIKLITLEYMEYES